MLPNVVTKKIDLPDGRTITVETGKLAKQADGSVVVRLGDTMLLATVVARKEAMEGCDFMPLSVDYVEKFASAGRIPGGFLKREGRLSDFEILTSRLIDRVLRPLFPDDYHADTQVMVQLISADKDALPDGLAALAASAALSVSDIPFNGPISEVRVIRANGEYIVNPTPAQIEEADINLMVGASESDIMMVEGEMKEVSEQAMLEGLKVAHEAIKGQCRLQTEMAEELGVVKREYSHEVHDEELKEEMFDKLYQKVYDVFSQRISDKKKRHEAIQAVKEEYIESLGEDHEVDLGLVGMYFRKIEKKAARNSVLDSNIRIDGRKLNEVRPIWSEVGYLPTPHGSAVFTRGETQSICTVTLGTKLDEQMIDNAMVTGTNKFLLHYNFPGFSTGEVKPNRGAGRREIGHGNLAYRALKEVIPPEGPDNPYTIRIVSDILESNGSSSMATVCGGALALMDAGIRIKSPVSGIAMGMISDAETGRYAVLSDILGDEDHLGDMDFKVTGTDKGLTACQMDMKIDGLSYEILEEALLQGKEGREHILDEMKKTIDVPRADYKPNAPRSTMMRIERDMIGPLIGPGGKVVQEIQKTTETTIVIEEDDQGGVVNIFATDQERMDKAVNWVKSIVAMPEVGEIYEGKVKSIMPFGAFIEFMPNKEGLLHISEVKWERLETLEGILEVGEEVKVKLLDIDKKTGKYKLSRKVLLEKPEGYQERSRGGDRGDRGGRGGNFRGGDRNRRRND
ncbi:polyribonucleotide nucleotidyltransferase [Fulvitalea axinellae]|uniref:Polyribonucleotide nucleotidyltransferase n=1 Tax=Fulvitalea axinellae TaxID=1182444 RepID=A0AAU9DGJ5_9BACT|nr:polyribonucleotide nucleotidyltransferase [Fulvitalea axinellae]